MSDTLDFDVLFGRIGSKSFLREYWSKRFLAVEEAVVDVQEVFSWKDLNEVLSRQRLPFPRIRLMKNGVLVPPETYSVKRPARRDQSSADTLDVPMINFHLKDGATLIVTAADEMSNSLAATCQSMSRSLGDHASVNIYASFGVEPGFPPHWDDHEVIILQLEGTKHWQIYEPTRLHPLLDDVTGNLVCPEQPFYDRHVRPGDVLYIPRGWWHRVVPTDEPSMHLTFGISPPTALDWLKYVLSQAMQEPVVRQNVPALAGDAEIESFRSQVVEAVSQRLRDAKVADFVRHHASRLKPRIEFSLPMSVMSDSVGDDTFIQFAGFADGGVTVDVEGDSVIVAALDRNWEFDRSVEPIIRLLLTYEPQTIRELGRAVPSLDAETLQPFFSLLLSDGFAKTIPPEDVPSSFSLQSRRSTREGGRGNKVKAFEQASVIGILE